MPSPALFSLHLQHSALRGRDSFVEECGFVLWVCWWIGAIRYVAHTDINLFLFFFFLLLTLERLEVFASGKVVQCATHTSVCFLAKG